jgi:hypothetical protein
MAMRNDNMKTLTWKAWLYLGAFLLAAALSCSQQDKKDETALEISLVDRRGDVINALGKERATEIYLSVARGDNAAVSEVNLEVVGDECSQIQGGQVQLAEPSASGAPSGQGLFLNSSPVKIAIPKTCQPGTWVEITLRGSVVNGGETVAIDRIERYEIRSLGDLPDIQVEEYKINRLRNRAALLFGETFTAEVSLINKGRRPLADARLTVSIEGALEAGNLTLSEQTISIPERGSLMVPLIQEMKTIWRSKPADAVTISLKWQSATDPYADGQLSIIIPVQRGLVLGRFLEELKAKQEVASKDAYRDIVPLDFVLHNESDVTLPAGRMWIAEVKGGKVSEFYDRIKFRSLNPRESIQIGEGQLSLEPDHEYLNSVGKKIIEVKVKWAHGDEEEDGETVVTQDLQIRRLEGNTWEAVNQ